MVQIITSKSVQETDKPVRAITKQRVPVVAKKLAQPVKKEPAPAIAKESAQTFVAEPVRPMDQQTVSKTTKRFGLFSFKSPEGKKESAPVITQYYPRPKTELARDAAQELVSNYGFKRLSVNDPFSAPVGSVLVYGTSRSVGHVEFRTREGFVSDFRSKTPSRRPLLGVYAKL